jgi:hypothetical protein
VATVRICEDCGRELRRTPAWIGADGQPRHRDCSAVTGNGSCGGANGSHVVPRRQPPALKGNRRPAPSVVRSPSPRASSTAARAQVRAERVAMRAEAERARSRATRLARDRTADATRRGRADERERQRRGRTPLTPAQVAKAREAMRQRQQVPVKGAAEHRRGAGPVETSPHDPRPTVGPAYKRYGKPIPRMKGPYGKGLKFHT